MKNKVDLEWYALIYDINKDKLVNDNILRNELVEKIIKEMRKKKLHNLEELKEYINSWLMYNYWTKSEFEIAITNLYDNNLEKAEKVDIYSQVKPNLDRIVEYINNKMQLNLI